MLYAIAAAAIFGAGVILSDSVVGRTINDGWVKLRTKIKEMSEGLKDE